MTKLLTTGEMVDRLQVNESALAYTFEGHEIPRMKVGKNDAHSIMVIQPWEVLDVNGFTLALKWRILPNYVSFDEAKEAMKEGNIVCFHDGSNKFSAGYDGVPEWVGMFTWKKLIEGNWTIEGEPND